MALRGSAWHFLRVNWRRAKLDREAVRVKLAECVRGMQTSIGMCVYAAWACAQVRGVHASIGVCMSVRSMGKCRCAIKGQTGSGGALQVVTRS